MEHILVVDDDLAICAVIAESLRRANYNVTICNSARETFNLSLEKFDLMIFDVMMPDIDGFELCRQVRTKVDCPILFLTAKTSELDLAQGLALGADDYIRKPFSPLELVSRVKAHLRRERRIHTATLCDGDIRFFLTAKEVKIKENVVPLTKMEYEICEFLIRHRGQVFSRDQLLEHSGDYCTDSEPAAIAEHIKNIRKKFGNYDLNPIKTIWGIGYKWELEKSK